METRRRAAMPQVVVGAGVLLLGAALAGGALLIPSAAGYGGVGPNFLPWVVAVGLLICGALILRESLTGGFRALDQPSGAEHGYWMGFVWISAGLLANAALITRIGFILGCTVCYMLAVQGLRRASGQDAGRPGSLLADLVTALAISAPVYWVFTKFLGINLPGITGTGWL
ncbi:MAG: Tripartite tricarboxylate transporter TctB family [uncultured Ramlibacter sp.]|uniref:Tripartite tricarboxylate transporter TctB family n=1 Tax=uncultured Ramlibacter sp. TaxID=260755 RepID=A0A6J4NW79_9BURK|nr:MAG: Tripartite tricarboxylate transporter TctB family [uncultured Ramlibacter sp.]